MNGQYALSSYIFVKMLMVHQLVYKCFITRVFKWLRKFVCQEKTLLWEFSW